MTTPDLKHAAFALMDALYGDADKSPMTVRQREDHTAAAGAVKDLIITFGWLDEFNAREAHPLSLTVDERFHALRAALELSRDQIDLQTARLDALQARLFALVGSVAGAAAITEADRVAFERLLRLDAKG